MAAALHAGPETFANRRSGAHVRGIPGLPEAAPQVCRRKGAGGQVPTGAELLHLRYLPDHLTTTVAGIRVVTLPFLLFQLAGSERPDRVERALNTICTKSPAVLVRCTSLDVAHDARLLAAGWAAIERIPEEWIWYDPDRAVAVVRETRRRIRRQPSRFVPRIPPLEAGSG